MKILQELRDSCIFCTLKHLGQAAVLMSEAHQDYPAHRWLAVGHMAEAAEECCSGFPKLAAEIRKHRVRYMEDLDYVVPIVKLIEMASKLLSEDDGGARSLRLFAEDISQMVSQLQRLNSGKQTPEVVAQARALGRKLDAAISARAKKVAKTGQSDWPLKRRPLKTIGPVEA